MKKYTFMASSSPLEILTKQELHKNTLNSIRVTLDKLLPEVSHTVYNSSAWHFNNAKIDTEIQISEEFKYFLQINIHYTNQFSKFTPFIFQDKTDSNISPESVIEIIPSSNIVVKNKDIMLDSTYLRNALLVDTIAEIVQIHVPNLSAQIHRSNIWRTIGTQKWEIKIPQLEEVIPVIHVDGEESIVIHTKLPKSFKQTTGFLTTDLPFQHETCVANASVPSTTLFAAITQLEYARMKNEYSNFASEMGITLYTTEHESNNLVIFTP